MLSEEVLDLVTERIVNRIEAGNTYVIEKIGRDIKEIGTLSYSEAEQLVQILKYGGDYDKIVKRLSEVTKLSIKDIKEIFEEVAKTNYKFAEQFYNYRNIKYIPYEENIALKSQVEAIANITARRVAEMMNPRVLGFGMIDKKTGEVTYQGLKESYYNLLDEAIMNISQGKETFNHAMSRQIKEMGGGGLKVIYDSTYINKEGVEVHNSRRLDSAIRMNIKDGLRDLHNENQALFGKQFDSDGVEITVHESPAPDHEDLQGKQFSNEQYENLQNNIPATDYKGTTYTHEHRPISMYNCYHKVFNIILGISKPEYSDDELQEIKDRNNEGFEIDGKKYTRYQGTQMQRKLESEIRKQKDIQIMSRASGQDDLVRESQQKITKLTTKYNELSRKANLPTKPDRMKVSGYHRLKRYDKEDN